MVGTGRDIDDVCDALEEKDEDEDAEELEAGAEDETTVLEVVAEVTADVVVPELEVGAAPDGEGEGNSELVAIDADEATVAADELLLETVVCDNEA